MSPERVWCPECGGPAGGVSYWSAGALANHRRRVHGVKIAKARKPPRTVEGWIHTVRNDTRTALAVQMALGEYDLRTVLRSLYHGAFDKSEAELEAVAGRAVDGGAHE